MRDAHGKGIAIPLYATDDRAIHVQHHLTDPQAEWRPFAFDDFHLPEYQGPSYRAMIGMGGHGHRGTIWTDLPDEHAQCV
jgi:hypothetical protein